jgi:hypothetical protein
VLEVVDVVVEVEDVEVGVVVEVEVVDEGVVDEPDDRESVR